MIVEHHYQTPSGQWRSKLLSVMGLVPAEVSKGHNTAIEGDAVTLVMNSSDPKGGQVRVWLSPEEVLQIRNMCDEDDV